MTGLERGSRVLPGALALPLPEYERVPVGSGELTDALDLLAHEAGLSTGGVSFPVR